MRGRHSITESAPDTRPPHFVTPDQSNPQERLFVRREGVGPDLVLLHGWGMSGRVWESLVPELAREFRVTWLDLPGHGRSAGSELGDLESVIEALRAITPDEAIWVGWSLGGLISLGMAHAYPETVSRLIVVAGTPRFVRGEGWEQAMRPETLSVFADGLESDYEATLKRFLSLQFKGVKSAQDSLRILRANLAESPPSQKALRDGLAMLRDTDLRAEMARIRRPLRFIFGSLDALVPPSVASRLVGAQENCKAAVIPGAGHAPFMSHREAFLSQLLDFLHD